MFIGRKSIIILAISSLLVVTGCGSNSTNTINSETNPEEYAQNLLDRFKINPAYSDDISGENAAQFIGFAAFVHEFDKTAFLDEKTSPGVDSLISGMARISDDINTRFKELNETEREIGLIISAYIANPAYSTQSVKNGHDLALINKGMGVTDKEEYLDITDYLEKFKLSSKEKIEKLSKYIDGF